MNNKQEIKKLFEEIQYIANKLEACAPEVLLPLANKLQINIKKLTNLLEVKND